MHEIHTLQQYKEIQQINKHVSKDKRIDDIFIVTLKRIIIRNYFKKISVKDACYKNMIIPNCVKKIAIIINQETMVIPNTVTQLHTKRGIFHKIPPNIIIYGGNFPTTKINPYKILLLENLMSNYIYQIYKIKLLCKNIKNTSTPMLFRYY